MTRVPSAQLADFAERAELALTAESLDPVEADRLDSDAYGRYRDARFEVPDGVPGGPDVPADDVLTLDLPAGNYFIAAKGIVEAGADVFDPDAVLCRLFADGDSDTGRLFLQHTAPPPAGTALTTTLSMQVLAQASQPFTIAPPGRTSSTASRCRTSNSKPSRSARSRTPPSVSFARPRCRRRCPSRSKGCRRR